MKFVKMHGIGNDYVFIDEFGQEVREPEALARRVSRRRFSVGSDGLILIGPSCVADARMRVFNADGSEAGMCGNGIRCVAKYLWDHGLCRKNPLSVETGAGVKKLELLLEGGLVSGARVDMGPPRLKRSEIPMNGPDAEQVVDEDIMLDGRPLAITCVSMGNPHCIIVVDGFDCLDWCGLGAMIETHELFPRRTNVHFVKVLSDDEVQVRTWERGSGATLACGTGASAVCVATVLLGLTGRKVNVHLPGGSLETEWCRDSGAVYMTGPAEEVFQGVLQGGGKN